MTRPLSLQVLLLLLHHMSSPSAETIITRQHLAPQSILVLNQDTDILLCPDTSCNFDSSSIIRVEPTPLNGNPVTVTVGFPGGTSHYGIFEIMTGCTVQFIHKGQWQAQKIKLSGSGTLRIDRTRFSTIELQSENEENQIIVAGGAQLATKMSTPMGLPGSLTLHGHSLFHAMGDVVFKPSSFLTWICGEKRDSKDDDVDVDVHVCGRLIVSGTMYASGEAHIQADRNGLVARGGASTLSGNSEISSSFSLVSAVDRMEKFQSVVIDATLQCAKATTSWSWSDFSLSMSLLCASLCARDSSHQQCTSLPSASPAPSSQQQQQPAEKSDEKDENLEKDKNETDESGRSMGSWLFVGVLIGMVAVAVAAVVVLALRNRSKEGGRRKLATIDGDSDKVELVTGKGGEEEEEEDEEEGGGERETEADRISTTSVPPLERFSGIRYLDKIELRLDE